MFFLRFHYLLAITLIPLQVILRGIIIEMCEPNTDTISKLHQCPNGFCAMGHNLLEKVCVALGALWGLASSRCSSHHHRTNTILARGIMKDFTE